MRPSSLGCCKEMIGYVNQHGALSRSPITVTDAGRNQDLPGRKVPTYIVFLTRRWVTRGEIHQRDLKLPCAGTPQIGLAAVGMKSLDGAGHS